MTAINDVPSPKSALGERKTFSVKKQAPDGSFSIRPALQIFYYAL
jgi:hypothetical protein